MENKLFPVGTKVTLLHRRRDNQYYEVIEKDNHGTIVLVDSNPNTAQPYLVSTSYGGGVELWFRADEIIKEK